MIIVRLHGGLGNQLFQYALARTFKRLTKLDVALDISHYKENIERRYELSALEATLPVATEEDVMQTIRRPIYSDYSTDKRNVLFRKSSNFIQRILPFRMRRTIRQRYFHYDAEILRVKWSAYIDGVWASEKYFKDTERILRRELRVKDQHVSGLAKSLGKELSREESVCIHVRRGDYAEDPVRNKIFGLCSIGYYKNAVAYIDKRILGGKYYIFTDDPEWVEKNMKIDVPFECISKKYQLSDLEEFTIMCACRHFIIANSTYSWWAAWLSEYREKKVVGPEPWMRQEYVPEVWGLGKTLDTSEILPLGWTRINSGF